MYNAGTYLLLKDDTVECADIFWKLMNPVSVMLDIGLKPPLETKEHVHLGEDHLSPCISGDMQADSIYEESSVESNLVRF